MKVMNIDHFILLLLTCCTIVTPINPNNFEKTKAEDDGLLSDHPNLFSSCDMTPQFCDINCCSDQDCSEEERRSFICLHKDHEEPSRFNYLDCQNVFSLDSFGNPLLCLQDHNSPYLGDFYVEDENFSDHSFFQILTSRNKGVSSFRVIDLPSNNSEYNYRYGSNIFFHDTKGKHHTINIASNILNKGNGYCSKVPIRFLINEVSNCFILMSEEQCLLNKELHLQNHVNVLNNLEYLGNINNVNVTYRIVCLEPGTSSVIFSKNVFRMTKETLFANDVIECESDTFTKINLNRSVCENVVIGLNFTISVNGTLLRNIDVIVFTANIPFNLEGFHLIKKDIFSSLNTLRKETIYVIQKNSVTYIDINKNLFSDKQGYVFGQPIYFNR